MLKVISKKMKKIMSKKNKKHKIKQAESTVRKEILKVRVYQFLLTRKMQKKIFTKTKLIMN